MESESLEARMAADPELRARIDALLAEKPAGGPLPSAVNEYPRFVFSRDGVTNREPGSYVKVRNSLDEESAGGTIIEKMGRAYLVDIQMYGLRVIVHEPDDSWVAP